MRTVVALASRMAVPWGGEYFFSVQMAYAQISLRLDWSVRVVDSEGVGGKRVEEEENVTGLVVEFPRTVLTLSGFRKFHLSWVQSHPDVPRRSARRMQEPPEVCGSLSPLNASLHLGADPSVYDVHLLPHAVSCG